MAPGQVTSVDALLLCGDRGASKAVGGESKAFLFLHGKPLFVHVLEAIERVARVRRVFIVGDKKRLDHFLEARRVEPPAKPVTTLEQLNNLLENVWHGFIATIDGYEQGAEQADPGIRNRVVFILPGDSPIISPMEIDDFFDRADMSRHDHVAGLTRREVLQRYYPAKDKPGIRMAYIYVREGVFRISNMHMARPFACANRTAIQQLYNSRYQKDIRNIIHLSRDMWAHHVKMHSLALYFMMQLSLFFAYLRLKPLNAFTRSFTPLDSVTAAVSRILGMRFGVAVTDRGGAALDIDNDKDYETMKQRFHEWKNMQALV